MRRARVPGCLECGCPLPGRRLDRGGMCQGCGPKVRRRRRAQLEDRFKRIGLVEPAGRLSMCQTTPIGDFMPTRYTCRSGAGQFRITVGCNHAMCQVCSRARSARIWRRYGPVLDPDGKGERARSVPMMTLTQRFMPGENAADAYRRFRRAWRRFLELPDLPMDGRRLGPLPTWRDALRIPSGNGWGGILSIEWAPRPGDGWHVHGHSLMLTYVDGWSMRGAWAIAQIDRRSARGRDGAADLLERVNVGRILSRARRAAHPGRRPRACHPREPESGWCSACGPDNSHLQDWAAACRNLGVPSGVDVRGVSPMEGLKYAVKDGPRTCSDEQLRQLVAATTRARRVSAWGAARAPKPEKGELVCPVCEGAVIPIAPLAGIWRIGAENRPRPPPDWWLRESAGRLRHAEALLRAGPAMRLTLDQEFAAGAVVSALGRPDLPAAFLECWRRRDQASAVGIGGASTGSGSGSGVAPSYNCG